MLSPVDARSTPRRLSRQKRKRTLISLTPLIDVVFILLVFFMLASSFLDWRAIELSAPGPAGAPAASLDGAVLVEIRPDGVRVGGEPVPLDKLGSHVNALVTERKRRVLIKPAPGVALQEAVRTLDRLDSAGIGNLSLIRDRGF